MYLHRLFKPGSDLEKYEKILNEFGQILVNSVEILWKAVETAMPHAHAQGGQHPVSVFALSRHVCESIDGMAVLAVQGCPQPAKPVLRSALEAYLGAMYILETDTARRGIAYQVAHLHRRIDYYRSLDPNEQTGKEILALLAKDSFQFSPPPTDSKVLTTPLDRNLTYPEFAPIEQEWQRIRQKKRKPEWFSMFGGPGNVRELAIHLKAFGLYEYLYREYSNFAHAGDGLRNFGKSGEPGKVSIKPVRHPEGLQRMLIPAGAMCGILAMRLLDVWGTDDERKSLRELLKDKVQSRLEPLKQGDVLKIAWQETTPA